MGITRLLVNSLKHESNKIFRNTKTILPKRAKTKKFTDIKMFVVTEVNYDSK